MNSDEPSQRGSASEEYDAKWSTYVQSDTRRRIRREVYGDEYPVEAEPRSFVTRSELDRMARELSVGSGDTFIDLGCGAGGPGLWMAAETGAALVGVDVSDVGITSARTRAEELGLTDRARFEVADVTSTGLEDRSLDAAMSVDTIWAIPDKVALLRETARILKDGARFVFTNWDLERSPPGNLPPVNDHRPLLQQAGFEIESYDIQPSEDKRRAYCERVVAAESALLDELGEEGTQKILYEPRGWLGLIDGTNYFPYSRRIFVVARRRPR